MIGEVLFIFWRLTEIVFLIPIIGMLVCLVLTLDETIRILTKRPGLLRQRLPQRQPAHSHLHSRSLHRQHYRCLLVS